MNFDLQNQNNLKEMEENVISDLIYIASIPPNHICDITNRTYLLSTNKWQMIKRRYIDRETKDHTIHFITRTYTKSLLITQRSDLEREERKKMRDLFSMVVLGLQYLYATYKSKYGADEDVVCNLQSFITKFNNLIGNR